MRRSATTPAFRAASCGTWHCSSTGCRSMRRLFLLLAVLLGGCASPQVVETTPPVSPPPPPVQPAQTEFDRWLVAFRQDAAAQGISAATLDAALPGAGPGERGV